MSHLIHNANDKLALLVVILKSLIHCCLFKESKLVGAIDVSHKDTWKTGFGSIICIIYFEGDWRKALKPACKKGHDTYSSNNLKVLFCSVGSKESFQNLKKVPQRKRCLSFQGFFLVMFDFTFLIFLLINWAYYQVNRDTRAISMITVDHYQEPWIIEWTFRKKKNLDSPTFLFTFNNLILKFQKIYHHLLTSWQSRCLLISASPHLSFSSLPGTLFRSVLINRSTHNQFLKSNAKKHWKEVCLKFLWSTLKYLNRDASTTLEYFSLCMLLILLLVIQTHVKAK